MIEIIGVITRNRIELIDITSLASEAVRRNAIQNGICVVYTPHTTAGIIINENADPDVKADINHFLEKLIPKEKGFTHSEGNSDSHIKAALFGNSRMVFVENGCLALGEWESIYFAEFDGPRKRKVWIKIIEC